VFKHLVFMLATSALLSACAPARNVYGGQCLDRVKIQLFGDSTMVGYTRSDSGYKVAPNKPQALLQAFFDKKYKPGLVTVENRAVSGTTAVQLVSGTDGLNKPWPQSVSADLVMVNHGINDMRQEDVSTYKAAMEALARAPAVVLFETQNATTDPLHVSAPFVQATREVAAANRVPLADTFTYTQDKTGMLSDTSHPTESLYEMISAHSVQPVAASIVSQLRCE
jgi:lysophospholipase L1-like esterase